MFTMSSSLPSSIAGFVPIPTSYSRDVTHVLYARAHTGAKNSKGKEAALPEDRTLFLVNVPPDATERQITLLFKSSGTVERVVFDGGAEVEQLIEADDDDDEEDDEMAGGEGEDEADEQPRKKQKVTKDKKPPAPEVVPIPSRTTRTLRRTGRTAHVVFLDTSSLSRALAIPSKPRTWPQDDSAPHGLAHYSALYAALRPPLDVVKAHADSWMEFFEYEQARKKHESKYHKGEAIVDDDGFTLVTRGGAYGQTVGGGVAIASKRFQETGSTSTRTRNNKKERKEKVAFYTFQIHEKQRKGASTVAR